MKQRIRIKMCGMTRRQDIDFAHGLGVDAIGLIFYNKSPRAISVEQAAELLQPAPAFMSLIGVFVNPHADDVVQAISTLPLNMLQFHGDENEAFCRSFGLPYIKALSADCLSNIDEAAKQYANASALLIDTPCKELRGGSGQAFAWQKLPQNLAMPIILAGGLNAQNVKSAVKISEPFAVDVCSGVEMRPGFKDQEKMKSFVNALGEQ